MENIRHPFLILAIILVALAFLLEIGAPYIVEVPAPSANLLSSTALADLGVPADSVASAQTQYSRVRQGSGERPPGYGIAKLALIDGLLLFSVLLMASSFLLGDRLQGRVQGIATLVVTFLVALAAIATFFKVLGSLIVMVVLLAAVPFGTIAYMALYSSFDTTGAGVILGMLFFLKVGFVACLFLAHQGFLRQRGLLLLIATSFVAAFIVGFLHALPPWFLVSITDAIAGLVNIVLGFLWAIVLLVFSIVSIIKAIRLGSRDQRAA